MTLAAAMMPRSRFVVSRFPAFISSPSSVRRTRRRVRRLRPGGVELVHHAHALGRHFSELLNRFLETPEFPAQIVNCRLELVPHCCAGVGKEEVTGCRADCRADNRTGHYHSRIVHTRLLRWAISPELLIQSPVKAAR